MNKTPICPTYLQSVQSIDEPLQRQLITLKNKIKKNNGKCFVQSCMFPLHTIVYSENVFSFSGIIFFNVYFERTFFLLTSQPTFSESIKRISFLSGN